jgi:hypothetical protein
MEAEHLCLKEIYNYFFAILNNVIVYIVTVIVAYNKQINEENYELQFYYVSMRMRGDKRCKG